MFLDKWYLNNCKLLFLEMFFDEISFLWIYVYCFELVIKYEILEFKEKMDVFIYNKIVMNYYLGVYCDIVFICFWFFFWLFVFMICFILWFFVIISVFFYYCFKLISLLVVWS